MAAGRILISVRLRRGQPSPWKEVSWSYWTRSLGGEASPRFPGAMSSFMSAKNPNTTGGSSLAGWILRMLQGKTFDTRREGLYGPAAVKRDDGATTRTGSRDATGPRQRKPGRCAASRRRASGCASASYRVQPDVASWRVFAPGIPGSFVTLLWPARRVVGTDGRRRRSDFREPASSSGAATIDR